MSFRRNKEFLDYSSDGIERPFDDAPDPYIPAKSVVNSGSIDTSSFDPYRQGVELTLDKFYQQGMVKIHSGYAERQHRLPQTEVGIDEGLIDPWNPYKDIDYFDPIAWIKAQEGVKSISQITPKFVWPIITSDSDGDTTFSVNGIIEPLVIRDQVGFSGTEFPVYFHTVRGCLQSGNSDGTDASDQVVSVDQFPLSSFTFLGNEVARSYCQTPFVDLSETFEEFGVVPITVVGFFDWSKAQIIPFVDKDKTSLVKTKSLDNDLLQAVTVLSKNENYDNYIEPDQMSADCGFMFDCVAGVGTDSVAYGGLVDKYVYKTMYSE